MEKNVYNQHCTENQNNILIVLMPCSLKREETDLKNGRLVGCHVYTRILYRQINCNLEFNQPIVSIA